MARPGEPGRKPGQSNHPGQAQVRTAGNGQAEHYAGGCQPIDAPARFEPPHQEKQGSGNTEISSGDRDLVDPNPAQNIRRRLAKPERQQHQCQ